MSFYIIISVIFFVYFFQLKAILDVFAVLSSQILKYSYLTDIRNILLLVCLLSTFIYLFYVNRFIPRILILICFVILLFKISLLIPAQYIGHGDEAAYAEMAQSIMQKRGLEVDYISYFFKQYEPTIVRPEDHWPPLLSFLIVPFFILLGKSVLADRLPSLIISAILMPILGYKFGKKITSSSIEGFIIGLSILFNPLLFYWSMSGYSDILFAYMVLLTLYLAICGKRNPAVYVWMGVAGGFAYYAKTTGILLLPLCVATYMCMLKNSASTDKRRAQYKPIPTKLIVFMGFIFLIASFVYSPQKTAIICVPSFILILLLCIVYSTKRNIMLHGPREFLFGVIIWILIILPFWIRNTIEFKNPVHSTQTYIASFIGYENWEQKTYQIYWDKKKPDIFQKIKNWETFKEKTQLFIKQNVWMALVPPEHYTSESVQILKDRNILSWMVWYPTNELKNNGISRHNSWIIGISAGFVVIAGIMVTLFYIALKVIYLVLCAFKNTTSIYVPTHKLMIRMHTYFAPYDSLFLLIYSFDLFVVFLSSVWMPLQRLILPVAVISILIGWWGIFKLLRCIQSVVTFNAEKWYYNRKIIGTIFMVLFFILSIPIIFTQAKKSIDAEIAKNNSNYYRDCKDDFIEAGLWIKNKIPDAIIMARNPWELHYYSQTLTVQIPNENAQKIFAAAKYYNVTHVIPESNKRQALLPWVTGEMPGLKLVYNRNGIKIFKIVFEKIPMKILN